jgi:hypothetical protein
MAMAPGEILAQFARISHIDGKLTGTIGSAWLTCLIGKLNFTQGKKHQGCRYYLHIINPLITTQVRQIDIVYQFAKPRVYNSRKTISLSIKANLAGFQCILLASGDVDTPASPMAPERASGAIIRNGTAVVMVLTLCPKSSPYSCDTMFEVAKSNNNVKPLKDLKKNDLIIIVKNLI